MARVKRKGRSYLANLVGISLLLYIVLSEGGMLAAGAALRQPGVQPWAPSLAQLLIVMGSLLPPILLVGIKGRGAGLRLPVGKGKIPIGVLLPLFLGIMVAVNSCANLLRSLIMRGTVLPAAQSTGLPEGSAGRVIYFITACIVAPILEELFFRGAVQRSLRPYGTLLSIVMSSLVFTLAHTNVWELPVIFVLGFIIGYVAEVSGSLLPGMILHAANNLAMFLILLERERIGGIATLALAFWMVLLFVALFAAALWMVSRYKLWPKFRLRRRAKAKAPPKNGVIKPKSALRRLLGQSMFTVGGAAMVVYCIIRLF